MRAVNYHAALPYPSVNGLKPNKKQAMLLIDGYCGQQSEFTTVNQYAYHHLKCLENNELARTIKGIYYVETHHLELLGRCVDQLGVDPRYFLYQNQRPIIWRADLVNYEKTMKDMLLADIEGENGAAEYYLKTAQQIGNDNIARLLLRLAEDEKLHFKIFSDLYNKYFGKV